MSSSTNFTEKKICTSGDLPTHWLITITACYSIGIFGNLLALILLHRKSKRPNNPKHRLMLNFLSANDLTAVTGMLILMYIQLYVNKLPESENDLKKTLNLWLCKARVVWRWFGLGSGCVTVVMAVERYLAITKPFFYQKNVTLVLLRRCIFLLWMCAVVLASMPLFGFGLYYDWSKNKCLRYRDGKTVAEVSYACLYFIIGMVLSVCIIFCNIAVMRSLCYKGVDLYKRGSIGCNNNGGLNLPRIREPMLVRRMSRCSSKTSTASTKEELAFGRLMGFLCIIFMICWIPQLLTIPLSQLGRLMNLSKECKRNVFYGVADILMALHFLIDPYVYVLHICRIRRLFNCYPRKKKYLSRYNSGQYSYR